MVAVVHTHRSLRACLNYNEQKVKTGFAACLDAGFYPMEAADLNFHQKLRRLEMLTTLNQRTKVNTLHVSLNFHPSEKPSEELLKEIAANYLEKIGFGGQPYLLYQHFDAGHPHIHLLTTNIKADGTAIHMHNLGRNQSKKAREEIELKYDLVQAVNAQQDAALRFKPVDVRRARYGRMETKKTMSSIINVVTDQYCFSSLAQLNAVLGLYNLVADPGTEDSRIKQHQGLVFRMLDGQGEKVGVPIKASDFAGKPTLKNLREKFIKNEPLKTGRKSRVSNMISMAFLTNVNSIDALSVALRQKGIDLVVRQNPQGVIYGLTFVDHEQKVVFNGNELGKGFSAKAILDRCTDRMTGEGKKQTVVTAEGAGQPGREGVGNATGDCAGSQEIAHVDHGVSRFTDALIVDGEQTAAMDWELKRTKRKKKRRIRLSAG
ncbi:relaxase [Mucilaginibacter achroorhodeus]|uniref:Relaxase n=1 Tax=Mucilaginibacter achroorhodeus TaxID=2599294 RepID=A0A563U5Y2_9SPHI|nr:relaxase/mobilization nuclease domain-containing protein [Mucilaginibacter achroorhodeus]TWR26760.1 relaxase [Mucilaginibacter achroorhodeus]